MGSTQSNEAATPSAASSAIGRMTLILDAFGDDAELAQHDFVTRTGLPKSTIHRTVALMVEFGWLRRLGSRYRLGNRLFELGGRVSRMAELREVAIPFLGDLYEATHEVVNLAVLDGTEVIYVEKVSSHRRIETPARIGMRFPAHCTALGKIMLADARVEMVDAVIAVGLTPRTDRTITDPDEFRAELDRVRVAGFAIDDGEFADGMLCCAAPVRGSGRAFAAVSVTGPRQRIDPEALRPRIERTAQGIAAAYLG